MREVAFVQFVFGDERPAGPRPPSQATEFNTLSRRNPPLDPDAALDPVALLDP